MEWGFAAPLGHAGYLQKSVAQSEAGAPPLVNVEALQGRRTRPRSKLYHRRVSHGRRWTRALRERRRRAFHPSCSNRRRHRRASHRRRRT